MMPSSPRALLLGASIAGLTLPLSLAAQEQRTLETPGVTQQLLLREQLAQFEGKQITVFTGEFEPGAATPLHKHPGTELLIVLEGQGEMHIAGRPSEALTPGAVLLVQPDAGTDHFIHQAVNGSDSAGMKTLVVVIHDVDTQPGLPLDAPP